MKWRVQDQEEDQRGPGERLYERTVKHVKWTAPLKLRTDGAIQNLFIIIIIIINKEDTIDRC